MITGDIHKVVSQGSKINAPIPLFLLLKMLLKYKWIMLRRSQMLVSSANQIQEIPLYSAGMTQTKGSGINQGQRLNTDSQGAAGFLDQNLVQNSSSSVKVEKDFEQTQLQRTPERGTDQDLSNRSKSKNKPPVAVQAIGQPPSEVVQPNPILDYSKGHDEVGCRVLHLELTPVNNNQGDLMFNDNNGQVDGKNQLFVGETSNEEESILGSGEEENGIVAMQELVTLDRGIDTPIPTTNKFLALEDGNVDLEAFHNMRYG
ncbi:hypothetical protein HAX54_029204 [Datura stramonium]|uniref:Uncharacterized protein n=1 Tax=Datura stramonium TaxID=4076 RepID=A0ABS8V7M0_DATST|nr:hypothetical protein [Datura stramonium]